ncbi:MAG: calcium-binding protein, partial [Pirellulales bacterium]
KLFIRGDFRNADPQGTNIQITGGVVFNSGEIFGDTNDDVINAGTAATPLTILVYAGNDDVAGGTEADMIYGGPGTDVLAGNDGNDLIVAGGGVGNRILGGPGNDRIFGSDEGAETDPDFNDQVWFG